MHVSTGLPARTVLAVALERRRRCRRRRSPSPPDHVRVLRAAADRGRRRPADARSGRRRPASDRCAAARGGPRSAWRTADACGPPHSTPKYTSGVSIPIRRTVVVPTLTVSPSTTRAIGSGAGADGSASTGAQDGDEEASAHMTSVGSFSVGGALRNSAGHTAASRSASGARPQARGAPDVEAERRRNRTYPPPGYDGQPVLKTGWGTSPVPLRGRG